MKDILRILCSIEDMFCRRQQSCTRRATFPFIDISLSLWPSRVYTQEAYPDIKKVTWIVEREMTRGRGLRYTQREAHRTRKERMRDEPWRESRRTNATKAQIDYKRKKKVMRGIHSEYSGEYSGEYSKTTTKMTTVGQEVMKSSKDLLCESML